MGEVGRELKKESMTDRVEKAEYNCIVDVRAYEVNCFCSIYLLIVCLLTYSRKGRTINSFPKGFINSLICLILVTHTHRENTGLFLLQRCHLSVPRWRSRKLKAVVFTLQRSSGTGYPYMRVRTILSSHWPDKGVKPEIILLLGSLCEVEKGHWSTLFTFLLFYAGGWKK